MQCAQQDWAWACPATRAASCSAADDRRTASAGSGYIGSIMRAPSYAIDHHRSKSSPEPILHRATKRRCLCAMLACLRRRLRGALHLLACLSSLTDSDPKARSALRNKEGGGQIDRLNGQGALDIRRER